MQSRLACPPCALQTGEGKRFPLVFRNRMASPLRIRHGRCDDPVHVSLTVEEMS